MFKKIEKNYKNNLREIKFNKYYWTSAISLMFISLVFKIPDNIKLFFIYISLFILVIGYFVFDYFKVIKKWNVKRKTTFSNKFKVYLKEIEDQNINNLILLLKQYNFKTKNDLKMAIDYYNSEKPIKVESDYLGWIVSIALTLSSFIEIAYNPETQTIDMTKISVILGSTIGIIIGFLIPIIIFKLLINGIIIQKKRLQSNLSEDLSYIYLNFDKYKNQLSKK
ncbi:MAG: hypothetical protein IJ966_04850 [Bacilli bacterium]|nr:hypothetical protein [Bacilli bacterium]